MQGISINKFQTVHCCPRCGIDEAGIEKKLILDHYNHWFECNDCHYQGKFRYEMKEKDIHNNIVPSDYKSDEELYR